MATRIKLKRGSGVPNESQLQEHEVAMDVSTGTIYVGSSSTDAGTDCAVLAEKNASNDTYTDAEAISAVEGEADLELSGTLKLGDFLNLDGNAIEDDGNLVLEVDSGALKLYHNDDLTIETTSLGTSFKGDLEVIEGLDTNFKGGIFGAVQGYEHRLIRVGAAYNQPSLTVGNEGSSVEDVVVDFTLFDGGISGGNKTTTIARLNAYSAAADDNRMYLLLDDDGSMDIASQVKNDAGDITHFNYGVFKVVSEHGSGGDDLLVVEENEPLRINSSDTYATAIFNHTLDTDDTSHTMVKFQTDMTDQDNYTHRMGFTAEAFGDNITDDDEGFCGALNFEWREDSNHKIKFAPDNYQNDVYSSRTVIEATTSVVEIDAMLRMQPIETDTTANRPSGSAGDLYFNTTLKNLQMYTNAWVDISNQKGMMFTSDGGVLYFYDGSDWRPVTLGTAL